MPFIHLTQDDLDGDDDDDERLEVSAKKNEMSWLQNLATQTHVQYDFKKNTGEEIPVESWILIIKYTVHSTGV